MKFVKKYNFVLIISLLILGCGIGFVSGYLTRRHGVLKKILKPMPQQSVLHPASKQGHSEIYIKKEVDYPFSFVVYGDSREPAYIEKNDIITQIIKEDPSFVVHVGVIQNKEVDN